MPLSMVAPAASASATLGVTPMPMTAMSAGMRSPEAVSTATTLPPSPTIRPTAVPRRMSLPQPRWSDRKCREISGATTRPISRSAASSTVTVLPSSRAVPAISSPMKPPPTTTTSLRRIERVAQGARIGGMAEREDAVEIDAVDRRQARRRAGGQRQLDRKEWRYPSVRTTAEPARSMVATSAPRRRSMAFLA